MPVLSGRATCNSQHAGALPATGFATEPTNVGVGGCQDDRLRCGQRVVCADPHTYSQQAKHDEIGIELEKVQFLPVGIGDSLHNRGWKVGILAVS